MLGEVMFYTLRDEKSTMKARFDAGTASRIVLGLNGSWKPYTSGEQTTRCFVFETDSKMMIDNQQVTIYFWKGDMLIEER